MGKSSAIACAALAAASGACLAQSNVTVFGRVDANVEYVNNAPGPNGGPGGTSVRVNSGGLQGSRWGLEGSERLNGVEVFFRLESGFNVDTGTLGQGGRLFGRGAYIGMRGGLGEIRLGRQYTSLFDLMEPYSMGKYPIVYEPAIQWLGTSYREDNMIKYINRLGAVTVEAHYAAGEVAGSNAASAAYGAGANYAAGPFGIALVYDDVNSALSAGGAVTRARKASIGMAYSLERWRLYGGYRWGRNDVAGPGLPLRDNFYFAGFNYKATPMLKLSAGYYYDQLKTVAPAAGGTSRPSPWTVVLLGIYSMSKRTELYAAAAYAKHSALDFDSLDGGASGYALAPGATSQSGLAFGMRQFF
ncbi:Outer membrane protein (porin) [Massilia sp. PDC64]|nr:porin [Massilia sp. PDC64]SDE78631.1 Outer membrane protein (porin) [Massilia sp. PDC64]